MDDTLIMVSNAVSSRVDGTGTSGSVTLVFIKVEVKVNL